MISGRPLSWLLCCFILLDVAYSGWQYYHQPLDGDMAWNALPAPDVAPTLSDPFGLATWRDGRRYANPNRYFGQTAYRTYLLEVPRLLQVGFDAVTSVYLAAAICKLATHLTLLLVLMRLVTGEWRCWRRQALIALALLVPLFQSNGYRNQMGIVDPSTTYTFFYALPAALLLIFLVPFVDRLTGRTTGIPGWPLLLGLGLLAPVLCLSGPLNPGVILVLTVVGIVMRAPRRLPGTLSVCWTGLAVLAAYSLFVGTYNSLSADNALAIGERYARLPGGVVRLLAEKIGPLLLLILLLVNYLLLRRHSGAEGWKTAYRWLMGFALLYTVLLPLGGYREYRPLIVRYDTWLPVTLAAIALYAGGAVALVKRGYGGGWYGALLLAGGLVFTLADKPESTQMACERSVLYEVYRSQQTEALDAPSCPVVDWQTVPSDYDQQQKVLLLKKWGILGER